MIVHAHRRRRTGTASPLLYGHFIEHFHRQIYGGIFDPGNPLSDERGFRRDVIAALQKIHLPILRWPGGCFVSSYHWQDGVGQERIPSFDKAWRVEDPNTFGTDEFVSFCREAGCEPYICTNAGTGTIEEMSDWLEYCNLPSAGRFARMRIANGYEAPHQVRYWSIGNENYGSWELGAKTREEWGSLTREAAKLMKHVDPTAELSAAALADVQWNVSLLNNAGPYLDWISIHGYWDMIHQTNDLAPYDICMSYTKDLDAPVRQVEGLLTAMGLEKIKIAFDEWNLRGWYHPNVHTIRQGVAPEEYLLPRDDNDKNESYTMADAVFSACFLNMVHRHCDRVGMANFAPVVNTRGCIFTYPEGLVLRSTYHVFDLYTNLLGRVVLDSWAEEEPTGSFPTRQGGRCEIPLLDVLVTTWEDREGFAIAVVNKDPDKARDLSLDLDAEGTLTCHTLNGPSRDSYNDIGREEVGVTTKDLGAFERGKSLSFPPHSVNVLVLEPPKR